MAQLAGKTDLRFVECAFKLFRQALGIKPVITPAQFLEKVARCQEKEPQALWSHGQLSRGSPPEPVKEGQPAMLS